MISQKKFLLDVNAELFYSSRVIVEFRFRHFEGNMVVRARRQRLSVHDDHPGSADQKEFFIRQRVVLFPAVVNLLSIEDGLQELRRPFDIFCYKVMC